MPGSIVSLLNEEEKTQLFSKRSPLHCDAGHQLFERGEPAENMYLVEKGKSLAVSFDAKRRRKAV